MFSCSPTIIYVPGSGCLLPGRGLTCAPSPPYPEEGAATISHSRNGRWRELVLFAHSYRGSNEARLEFKPKSSGLKAWHLASMRRRPRDHPDRGPKPSLPLPILMLVMGMGKQTLVSFPSLNFLHSK